MTQFIKGRTYSFEWGGHVIELVFVGVEDGLYCLSSGTERPTISRHKPEDARAAHERARVVLAAQAGDESPEDRSDEDAEPRSGQRAFQYLLRYDAHFERLVTVYADDEDEARARADEKYEDWDPREDEIESGDGCVLFHQELERLPADGEHSFQFAGESDD